jgi:hypothetical protein
MITTTHRGTVTAAAAAAAVRPVTRLTSPVAGSDSDAGDAESVLAKLPVTGQAQRQLCTGNWQPLRLRADGLTFAGGAGPGTP